MEMLKTLEKITEAARKQNITITDILTDGTVISENDAYLRKYKLKESGKKSGLVIEGHRPALKTLATVLKESEYNVTIGKDSVTINGELEDEDKDEIASAVSDVNDEYPDEDDLSVTEQISEDEGEEGEDEEGPELELSDEESKTDYATKLDAINAIVNAIVMDDFDKAKDAFDDYYTMAASGEGDEDEVSDEELGLDDDSMMDVDDEDEGVEEGMDSDDSMNPDKGSDDKPEDDEELEEDFPDFVSFLGKQKQGSKLRKAMGDKDDRSVINNEPDEDEDEMDEAWDTDYETPKDERGKYDGKDIKELKSMLSDVKDDMKKYEDKDEKVPSKLRQKFSELTFAIRAKQKDQWGDIK